LCLQIAKCRLRRLRACDKQQALCGVRRERFVNDCREATAQFIAEHSLSYRLANGDPDQRGVVAGKPIGSIDDETLRCRASSLTPQAGEVRPAAQACKTAHQEVRRPLNRKTMTPLFSAAGENLTSLFGAHPF